MTDDPEESPCCPDCGNDDRRGITYIDAYANGHLWRCKACGEEFLTPREENEE